MPKAHTDLDRFKRKGGNIPGVQMVILMPLKGSCHEIFYLCSFTSNNCIGAHDPRVRAISYIQSRFKFAEIFDFQIFVVSADCWLAVPMTLLITGE
jgi:hypothetical protein